MDGLRERLGSRKLILTILWLLRLGLNTILILNCRLLEGEAAAQKFCACNQFVVRHLSHESGDALTKLLLLVELVLLGLLYWRVVEIE